MTDVCTDVSVDIYSHETKEAILNLRGDPKRLKSKAIFVLELRGSSGALARQFAFAAFTKSLGRYKKGRLNLCVKDHDADFLILEFEIDIHKSIRAVEKYLTKIGNTYVIPALLDAHRNQREKTGRTADGNKMPKHFHVNKA